MNTKQLAAAAALLLSTVLAGCMFIVKDGTPDTPIAKAAAQRRACKQAYEQGWCSPPGGAYDNCRVKPVHCCEPKPVQCGPGGCIVEGCNGERVFSPGMIAIPDPRGR